MKTLKIWDTEYPIIAELGDDWFLVAHPNGPAIATAAAFKYLGSLAYSFPDVPDSIRTKAIEALMTECHRQRAEIRRLRNALSLVIACLRNGSAASPDASLEFLCDSGPREVLSYCTHLRGLLSEVIQHPAVAPLHPKDPLFADVGEYSVPVDTTHGIAELTAMMKNRSVNRPVAG
jgi:hypothetical protein